MTDVPPHTHALGDGPAAWPRPSPVNVTRPDLGAHLAPFERVGLDDLGAAGLMRREDTKFLLNSHGLPDLLRGLERSYRLLEVAGLVEHDYRTLYFDTQAYDLFMAHHRGVLDRYKVRERKYVSTDTLFLEVKHRDKKGVTRKSRTATAGWDDDLDPAATGMAGSGVTRHMGKLVPVMLNAYQRLTLVAVDRPERVTIDTGLWFSTPAGSVGLGHLSVAEVKQERIDRTSLVMARLRELGVRPGGFSKYCMGVSLLVPGVKHNRFKPRLRRIDRLTGVLTHVA